MTKIFDMKNFLVEVSEFGTPHHRSTIQQFNDSTIQITFASCFNLSTNSSTVLTRAPALRRAGGSRFNTLVREMASTPSSDKEISWSGFFLAFMIPGRET